MILKYILLIVLFSVGMAKADPRSAIEDTPCGQEVIVKNGTYTYNRSITRNRACVEPVIVKAESIHGVHIIVTQGKTLGLGTLTGNTLNFTLEGFVISGSSGDYVVQIDGGKNVTLRNNKIYTNQVKDIVKINSGSDYALLENNEIYNTSFSSCSTCNADGIDITGSDHVVIRNNHIHHIPGWGAYAKKGSKFNIIENNLIHDINKGGIGLGESSVVYDSIARNNLLYNIGMACLQASGAKDSTFENNTCLNGSTKSTWGGLRIVRAENTNNAKAGDNRYSYNVKAIGNTFVIDAERCLNVSDSAFLGDGIAQFTTAENTWWGCSQFRFKGEDRLDRFQARTLGLGQEQEKGSVIIDPGLTVADLRQQFFGCPCWESLTLSPDVCLDSPITLVMNKNVTEVAWVGEFNFGDRIRKVCRYWSEANDVMLDSTAQCAADIKTRCKGE